MATITPVQGAEAFVQHTPVATASGGDVVATLSTSKTHVILLDNTAASPVTVDITPSTTSGTDISSGAWTKAALSLSIPAGEQRSVTISGSILSAYLNGSNQVPVTYTSHDVGLLISAIAMP